METLAMPARPTLTARWPKNGRVVETDLQAIGPMLAYYRTRLGLSRGALATLSLTTTGVTIGEVEKGKRTIGTRNLALRLAHALKLTDLEIDHFLYVAGYAPIIDWQQLCEEILVELGAGDLYESRSEALYAELSEPAARQARVPVKWVRPDE